MGYWHFIKLSSSREELDIELPSLSQSAVHTDCDTKAVPGGQDLFLGPITQSSELSIQSTHAGTIALTQTGAVSWMLSTLRLPDLTSHDHRT